MASRFFKPSRIVAVALILGAGLWIASGELTKGGAAEEAAQKAETARAAEAQADPVQKVAVSTATPEKHDRQVVLSCITQADHRAFASARGGGLIVDLKVHRGSAVMAGDVVAVISDEGRVRGGQAGGGPARAAARQRSRPRRSSSTGAIPRATICPRWKRRWRPRRRRSPRPRRKRRNRSCARRSTASSIRCPSRSDRRSRPAPRSPRSSGPTRCWRSAG